MRRALLAALTVVALTLTGVAIATPVTVLSVSDGRREVVRYVTDGEMVTYSYVQSIYQVPVYEEFVRSGDRLEFLRVLTTDIRAIEYLRWDTPIQSAGDYFVADAPAADAGELVIRISPGAEQRLRAGGWSFFLHQQFGDTVVRVKLERPGLLPALVRGLGW